MAAIIGKLDYRVPYADTDQMGFVYYANYLVFFERSRNELMRAMGFTYRELEALGIGMPVIQAHLTYHKPAKYDDVLTITGRLTALKGVRCTVSNEVRRGDELLVEGYTEHAFMDLKTGRPKRLPEDVMQKFILEDI